MIRTDAIVTEPPKWTAHAKGRRYYTRRGFERRIRKRLYDERKMTCRQVDKVLALYFGNLFATYMDEHGIYKRQTKIWRIGSVLKLRYRVDEIFKLAERSGLFYLYRDAQGKILAVQSPATFHLKGCQMSIF